MFVDNLKDNLESAESELAKLNAEIDVKNKMISTLEQDLKHSVRYSKGNFL
jgi:hypothetical protein